jgi:hypothetical protein
VDLPFAVWWTSDVAKTEADDLTPQDGCDVRTLPSREAMRWVTSA